MSDKPSSWFYFSHAIIYSYLRLFLCIYLLLAAKTEICSVFYKSCHLLSVDKPNPIEWGKSVSLPTTLKEKWSHFDLKSGVTGRTNIGPGIPSNWFISSQFDSNILQLLGIPGPILVPTVTQLFRSKWLHFWSHFEWRSGD